MTFIIYGKPVTKGSTRSFLHPKTGKVVTTADNTRLKSWTRDCRVIAQAMKPDMIHKPHAVKLRVEFTYQRPKHPQASRPTVRPDLDKTLRAVLDALTSVCYADDSQVTHIETSKAYGPEDKVLVTVERLEA